MVRDPLGRYSRKPSANEIIRDTVGCIRNQKEQDQNLEKSFKRAKEKEMTFNKDKCEFNKGKCLYYGMVFSKEGASPDPMKGEAIKQAEPHAALKN